MDLQKQKLNKMERINRVDRQIKAEEHLAWQEQVEATADELLASEKQEQQYIEQQTATDEVLTPTGPLVAKKDPYIVAVESVLEENLGDLYASLPENRRAAFKKEGEVVATKIEKIIRSAKVSLKKIIDLIRGWLLMIPGVNKLFLEQEAKIKADKILALRETQVKK